MHYITNEYQSQRQQRRRVFESVKVFHNVGIMQGKGSWNF